MRRIDRVMRNVITKAVIATQDGAHAEEVEALVDTAATLTVIPQRLAEKLSLQQTGYSEVETAAGRLRIPRSRARVEIDGESEIVPVLISDIIDKTLIGVTTLEVLGLGVDPISGKLKRWSLLLY